MILKVVCSHCERQLLSTPIGAVDKAEEFAVAPVCNCWEYGDSILIQVLPAEAAKGERE